MKEKNYIDTIDLTALLVEYNRKNNPIKIYNHSFDYYITTYQTAPIKDELKWIEVIELRKEYEFKKVDKSLIRRESNENTDQSIVLEDERTKRKEEISYFIYEVKLIDPIKGKLKPIEMPIELWKGIDSIANHFSTNYKFFMYVNREDLVMSAIEKCIRYMSNFSGCSSGNAFSYFSTVVRNSFFMDIKKEYGYSNLKQKLNAEYYDCSSEEKNEKLSKNI